MEYDQDMSRQKTYSIKLGELIPQSGLRLECVYQLLRNCKERPFPEFGVSMVLRDTSPRIRRGYIAFMLRKRLIETHTLIVSSKRVTHYLATSRGLELFDLMQLCYDILSIW